MNVEPVSAGAVLKRAQTFAQIRPEDRWVALSFSLPRIVTHERSTRKEMEYHSRYYHVANLRNPDDLEDRLRGWPTEALPQPQLTDLRGTGAAGRRSLRAACGPGGRRRWRR